MNKTTCLFLRVLCLFVAGVCFLSTGCASAQEQKSNTSYAMSTVILQKAYGPQAEQAMNQVNDAFLAFEDRLSLFGTDGDIAQINQSAGKDWVLVEPETAELLQMSQALSSK
ncbi:MAG: FAD:protein FMN transferase, partial [Saezia sp.]